jgi:hypothetical protein
VSHHIVKRSSVALAALVVAVALVTGCSSGDTAAPSTTTGHALSVPYAVGHVSQTLVDTSRPTPANGDHPPLPERTIMTSIYYPADGGPGAATVDGTPGDQQGAPFPLVVLGHGLGGNEDYLTPLAQAWVAAGYVVAMPHFPLTYAGTPGGVNGADVQSQPGDVTFVIDQMLSASTDLGSPLAGLVDSEKIGVAGHSNGAITVLGLVANSCCRDARITTAIVLSGSPSPYVGGVLDLVLPRATRPRTRRGAARDLRSSPRVESRDRGGVRRGQLATLPGAFHAQRVGPGPESVSRDGRRRDPHDLRSTRRRLCPLPARYQRVTYRTSGTLVCGARGVTARSVPGLLARGGRSEAFAM